MNAESKQTARGEQVKAQRRRRNTDSLSGRRRRMAVDETKLDRENYVYRFANDDDRGRLHALTVEDDWEVVHDRASETKADSAGMGTEVSVSAGVGERGAPLKAVLLRKPKRYHDEDYAARQRRIDETEAGLKRGSTPGGDIDGKTSYIPDSGIRIGRE